MSDDLVKYSLDLPAPPTDEDFGIQVPDKYKSRKRPITLKIGSDGDTVSELFDGTEAPKTNASAPAGSVQGKELFAVDTRANPLLVIPLRIKTSRTCWFFRASDCKAHQSKAYEYYVPGRFPKGPLCGSFDGNQADKKHEVVWKYFNPSGMCDNCPLARSGNFKAGDPGGVNELHLPIYDEKTQQPETDKEGKIILTEILKGTPHKCTFNWDLYCLLPKVYPTEPVIIQFSRSNYKYGRKISNELGALAVDGRYPFEMGILLRTKQFQGHEGNKWWSWDVPQFIDCRKTTVAYLRHLGAPLGNSPIKEEVQEFLNKAVQEFMGHYDKLKKDIKLFLLDAQTTANPALADIDELLEDETNDVPIEEPPPVEKPEKTKKRRKSKIKDGEVPF